MKQVLFTLLTVCFNLSINAQSLNIVFDGDSQTSTGTWPLKIIELLQAANYSNIRYVNFAVSGQTTSEMVSDVSSQVVPRYSANYDENLVLYYIGYNDTWAGSSLDAGALHDRLVTYYKTLKSAGFKVLMINLPDGYNRTGISLFNNMYATRNSDIADVFVNCRQSGGVFEDYSNTTYYRDNVHLSTSGLNYLAQRYVYDKLLQLIDVAPPPTQQTTLLTGLESYYKLDETTGIVKDETGNSHGTASATTGKVNGAYAFDAHNDFISLSKPHTFKTGTYTFWINISSITDDLTIMANDAYYSRIFIGANNNLKLETNTNGQEFAFYNSFTPNTWYHIALVRNNDNLTCYRNGVSVGSQVISNSGSLTISQIGFNGRSFRGMIDEIGIWSRPLTATEVSSVYKGSYPFTGTSVPATIAVTGITLSPASASLQTGTSLTLAAVISPQNATNKNISWSSDNTNVATVNTSGIVTSITAGTANITALTADGGRTAVCRVTVSQSSSSSLLSSLKAYYKFDEISGNAKDETGNNTGQVSASVTRVAGRINGAYYFDDNNDFVALTSPITLKTATYSFWIKILSITDDLIIMGNGPWQSRIFIGSKNNIKLETNTNGEEFAFYHAFAPNTWYHVALVRENDNLKYYRNGILAGNATINSSNNLTISQLGLSGRSFRGTIDEAGIWDRALTASEISFLNSGYSYPFTGLKSTSPDNEVNENQVLFYPNPAHDRINLNGIVTEIKLYDLRGRLMISKSNQDFLDVSTLYKGIYLLEMRKDNDITVNKLIVE